MNPEHDYLSSKLPAPVLPTLDSPWFQAEIERVLKERNQPIKEVDKAVA
eukprot:CAMPEP_0170466372 /NCGR_PEP_ID=MMETSP0123-20130129/10360_1 /TAXON_ID=182087 /ORGANISM="Favella ehrenbergii, Strain Fehren 1" /LENGTH=48 /DNA_ID= /DNA_START= /DNA_END= /DNA_ORIENTATION=